MLEYLACREAFVVAYNACFFDIIIERDSLIVIQTISSHVIPTIIDGLIKNIIYLINSFRSISFKHVRRYGNKAVYPLAYKAIKDHVFLCNRMAQLDFILGFTPI